MKTPSAHPARPRRGFTLAELIAAMLISGIILAAVASLVSLTARVMPSNDDTNTTIVHDRIALDAVAADIDAATSVTAFTSKSITLQMQDMDGDGNPETIVYSWGGTPGNGLMRTYNSGTPVAVITNVQSLTLTKATRTHSRTTTGAAAWDTTHLLYWCDQNANSIDSYSIQTLNRAGMVFTPRLPSDATQYTIDYVRVMLAGKSPYTGSLAVSLNAVTAGNVPNGLSIYSSVNLSEPTSTTASYVTAGVTAGPLAAGTMVALVVAPALLNLDSTPGVLSMEDSDVADTSAWSVTTSNGGLTWTIDTDGGVLFEVYGRTYRPVTSTSTATRNTDITLALTKSDGTYHETSANIIAQPE